jgi:hypothetical protein
MDSKALFNSLYNCKTEDELHQFIENNPDIFKQENWFAVGANESNYGIIENQQSSPIAALVEKVTNSIDALLMKKCLERGIAPKSNDAPKSMNEAVLSFYGKQELDMWSQKATGNSFRRKQALDIQLVADGPPRNTSVIVYDNGEGQHPDAFEDTFLSLVRGNKNEIQFVQGKYNMGGSGAIVFCGKKGYQLIASKRFDNTGQFGFTLVREHPLSKEETQRKKNTWYEFLKINDVIPRFDCAELDLKLHDRLFKTGTVIKLYSYQFPSGYAGFAQDLNQSINEFLFEPVLPIYTVDKKERYPNNKVLEQDLFGLKRRLEDEKDYVEDWFSETYEEEPFGKMKVTCYVFRAKQENKSVSDTKADIRRRYFKNGMSVLFSMNGQVHGHYTTEFISRTLKFNLLKDYLLIHVECTDMSYDFRKELFMASRDRLKGGEETDKLREFLGRKLRSSQLDEVNRRRKESIGLESEDTTELIKSFAKNLPKDSDLFKLLQNTLKLEEKKEKQEKKEDKTPHKKEERTPFKPERFPSFFKFHNKKDGKTTVVSLPQGGERNLKFDTDAENHYLDRTEEPGELKVAVLDIKRNEKEGGDKPGADKEPGELLNVTKSSPKDGIIKVAVSPTKELQVGDEIQIQVSLKGAGETFEELVWLQIIEPEARQNNVKREDTENIDNIGLPELKTVKREEWERLELQGIEMNHSKVMFPQSEGDKLERIYVNLDSNVLLNQRKKLKNEDQITIAQKRYVAAVYFHSLFLYMITKRKGYILQTNSDGRINDVTVDDYIKDVFDSYYSDFLLNFGMEQLVGALGD